MDTGETGLGVMDTTFSSTLVGADLSVVGPRSKSQIWKTHMCSFMVRLSSFSFSHWQQLQHASTHVGTGAGCSGDQSPRCSIQLAQLLVYTIQPALIFLGLEIVSVYNEAASVVIDAYKIFKWGFGRVGTMGL